MHDNKSYWFDCRHSSAFTKEEVNCIAEDKVGGRYYGTDIGSKDELIACKYTPEEMAKMFGADSVGFLPLADVTELATSGTCKGYCKACFDGEYPTEGPQSPDFNKDDVKISENKN